MPNSPSRGGTGRRTQAERSASTIRKILDASTQCLLDNGYAKTSTIEIAQAAGLSQGALFRHFASRVDLMAALANDLASSVLDRLDAGLASRNTDEEPLASLLADLEQLCTDSQAFALYELIDGSRSDPALAAVVIEVWLRLQNSIVDRSMSRPWPAGIERSRIEDIVFISMRVWEAEARFRAVVGESVPLLNTTRDRFTALITQLFEHPMEVR